MRQLTESEHKVIDVAWLDHAYGNLASSYDSFEAGFTAGLDHADTQLAAVTAERDALRTKVAWLENSIDVFTAANRELTLDCNLALRQAQDETGETCKELEAERDALREALFKATKELKRMAKGWREYAAGNYCQNYNIGMGQGLTESAANLEDYVNDTWRALNPQGEQE